MTYYTHHRKNDALHCVFGYVSSDYWLEQMPYYTRHSKMQAFQYVHRLRPSKNSGKKIKEKILTYILIKTMSVKIGY